MKLHVIASGSRGNAALIENEHTGEGVLIDCGICKRDALQGFENVGFDVTQLSSILITHDHSDHTKGLGVLLRALAKHDIHPSVHAHEDVVAASKPLREALSSVETAPAPLREGLSLSCAGFQVHVFATSHDAAASFGFRIEEPALDGKGMPDVLGYLTDSGIIPPAAHEALCGTRILALESNHDLHMLRTGPYPFALKERVASELGHLSNDQAACELACIAEEGGADRLEHVVAMHISQNNNTYRLPREVLGEVAQKIDPSIAVISAYQERIVSIE